MFKIYTYRLPFKRAFVTGAGTFYHREGLLIRFQNSQCDCVSEAAPLPGFSSETLSNVIRYFQENQADASRFFNRSFTLDELKTWINSQQAYPSVAFGLSTLGLNILTQRQEVPLHKLLGLESADSLSVNAVIGAVDQPVFLKSVRSLVDEGFRVIKCKAPSGPGHLPDSIKKIHNRHPGIRFRLDANRSWPAEKLESYSAAFEGLPVEYIEEPVAFGSLDNVNQLIHKCAIPVALDESLTQFGLTTILRELSALPYLIIKPTLHGNIFDVIDPILKYHHLNEKVIFTSSLESLVGVKAVAAVAGIAGSRSTAHGLNTGTLFHEKLADNNLIMNGTIRLDKTFNCWISFQDINKTLITPV